MGTLAKKQMTCQKDHVQLSLTVNGIPRPQPRPRMFKGRTVSNADPKARAWASAIVRVAHEALAPAGAIHVNLLFRMPTNKSNRHGQPHTFRPDSDNLAKLVLDALMRSKSITDDSLVSRLSIRKVWSSEDRAGVDILVETDAGVPADSPIDPPRWLAGGGNVGH